MENDFKQRILGIDSGTNSLGWAVVDRLPQGGYELVDKGVQIFQEGVKLEKGNEKSRASERTDHRSLRKQYWRRKVRKIRLLTVLSNAGLCPPLSVKELRAWRAENKYPLENEAFMRWQRTDENKGINPYAARCKCVEQELYMDDKNDRYLVGRAFYHICQRRGFLSNRKEQPKEDANRERGKVKESIHELTKNMQEAGCDYLCQYFYKLYQHGERIRSNYTDRKEHYEKEFDAICKKQRLDEALVKELYKIIFVPRPLKSQRRGVAKCPFEPSKHCAPVSHPLFEEFRMWSFIRNIKVLTPADSELRVLTDEEVHKILPLWYRKSKAIFPFEDIAITIAGKGKYCYNKSAEDKPYRFNYYMDTSVAGCPISARLRELFDEEVLQRRNKIDDLWNALDYFDDDVKLHKWVIAHYHLTEEQAEKFVEIRLPQGYASLSLKAIENILPLMRDHRMNYPNATLVAKLHDFIEEKFDDEVNAYLVNDVEEYLTIPTDKDGRPLLTREERQQRLHNRWKAHYKLSDKQISKLYHPSMIEEYRKVESKTNGVYQLGSPRISAMKNPMAMRSLFRMKAVVNQLLKEAKIDENTIVHIEFARELNDANSRAAIRRYQKLLETMRAKAIEAIEEFVTDPSEDDILKYLLWQDQNGKCIYTNRSISLEALFKSKDFDIEHTVPRSMGGDTTRTNLTLCDAHFNREIKRNQLPSQLSEQQRELILSNIRPWKDKYEDLDKQIRKQKGRSASASTKEEKDKHIQERHLLELQRDFWRSKYEAFTITEDKVQGFTRRQGTDISVISRYGRLYLLSLFPRVDVVKGSMTAAFRKVWGIQSAYEKKNRDNHVHHCIDAITIACMGKREYDELSAFYHEEEENRYHQHNIFIPKPWQRFTEDIKDIEKEIFVSHHTSNPMGKQTKKKLRDSNGHILRDKNKQPIYTTGATARGVLHRDTQYGAIMTDGQIRYVLRMSIDNKDLKVENIVDKAVREKVQESIHVYGSLAKALEAGPIWMNKEKGVAIKKVRVFTPSVTRPNHIRLQRDFSKHEYKRQYHVMNESNYMLAIYEGIVGGKTKRSIKIISNLDAAIVYNQNQELIPACDENDYKLLMCLKLGTLLLLYESSPEELYSCNLQELRKRLYKVTGLSSMVSNKINYAIIELTYHQEARPSTAVKAKNGAYKTDEELRPKIRMYHTKINALVQGHDFEITDTGKIIFKHA